MKQVELTDTIRTKLKATAGEGADLNNLAVFRATAINTLPVRKKHPVYSGGVHTRTFLEQMLTQLKDESLPLQIMHDGESLPSGRIFDGEIIELSGRTELQVLFWVDKTSAKGSEYVSLVDNGTIDQVSVAILPKSAVSNKSGFDFLGSDATFENIWTGTDPDGNVMGENGAHVLINALETWFEMSLVGRGGITGAKIHASGDMKLAASGIEAPRMTLLLSMDNKEPKSMDLTELVTKLTATSVELAEKTAKLTIAEAEIVSLNAKVAELQPKVDAAAPAVEKLTAAEAEVEALKGHLNGVFSHVAAITGDATSKPPAEYDDIVTGIKTNVGKLRPNSRVAFEASAGTGDRISSTPNSAFKRRA